MLQKSRVFLNMMVLALLVTATCLPTAAGRAEPPAPQADAAAPILSNAQIRDFHLLTTDAGWVLLDDRLFWTGDGGNAWQDVAPAKAGGASIQAVDFLDARSGWVVLTGIEATGEPLFQLAQTTDSGSTWQISDLSLFEPGDWRAQVDRVYLSRSGPSTAWLVVKQPTGRSFSAGVLFKTEDGGQTWLRRELPLGEPVYFANDESGWVAGGAAGNELYHTQDGGLSWSPQSLPGLNGPAHLYLLPSFSDPQNGILPAVTNDPSGTRLDFFTTADGGHTWQPGASAPLDQPLAPGTRPALSLAGGRDWTVIDSDRQEVFSASGARKASIAGIPGTPPAGITGLDMVTPMSGWAKLERGSCQPPTGSSSNAGSALACTREAGLLSTSDGGLSWKSLALPPVKKIHSPDGVVQLVTGQGFDSCDIPDLGQMQTWMNQSPYRTWNLYIGGSALASCGQLTAAYISMLSQQGWKFIPTWVGPQASCSQYSPRMSSDPTTAYNQGVSEANAAVERAANLLLTQPNKTGAIIYYDLESYDYRISTCRSAAKSFIAGWVAQLHARGNQAGVYGSGCTSVLSDFATNPQVPDAVWIASWNYDQFSSDASVWDVGCLSNNLWSNHQRLRQYAGGHNETWGGVTFNIDSDVVDGPLLNLGSSPLGQITSPADNTWLPTNQVNVAVTPASPSAAIARVDFLWHSSDWINSGWVNLGSDTNGSDGWSITFNTSALPDQKGGALFAEVYDSANNRTGSGVWNLGIDRTPPTVSLSTAPMYVDAPFRDFHVYWTGSDATSGPVSYDLQYRDSTSGTWSDLLTNTTNPGGYPGYIFIGLANHTYYFRGRARDAAGNLGAYSTADVHFTVTPCPLAPDAYEADGSPAAAKPITTDGVVQAHNFDTEGDEDWVKFDAASTTPYTIQTANTGGHSDTVLYLYGPDGTILLSFSDDYPGMNFASRIDWQSAAAGTYYIKVKHYDPYGAGCTTEYGLSVTQTNNYRLYLPVIK